MPFVTANAGDAMPQQWHHAYCEHADTNSNGLWHCTAFMEVTLVIFGSVLINRPIRQELLSHGVSREVLW